MKKYCIIFFAVMSLLVLMIGCSGDSTGASSYAIDVDPGPVEENCCGVSRYNDISGVARPGGGIYCIGLFRNDTLVQLGDTVFIEEGPFQDVILRIDVSHLDGIPPGDYSMRAFSVPPNIDKIDYEDRTIAAELGTFKVADYSDSTCQVCCTRAISRYRAFAYKNLYSAGGCVGAEAKIKTRYGKLCGNVYVPALVCAWVGIQESISDWLQFTWHLQAGYKIERVSEDRTDTGVYLEFYPYNVENGQEYGLQYDYTLNGFIDKPVEGEDYRYHVSFDPLNGDFSFIFNDYFRDDTSYGSSLWANKTMQYAVWQGEIDARESDMPGTDNNKCEFKECRYYDSDEDRLDAYFLGNVDDHVGITHQSGERPEEWGIWVDTFGTWLKIWDIYPLPD